MTFSERQKLTPVRKTFQIGEMDDALRASLWNVLHRCIWDIPGFLFLIHDHAGEIKRFSCELWFRHFKKPYSSIPGYPEGILMDIQLAFFQYAWNEVYDFLEVVLDIVPSKTLVAEINAIMERELAGYHLINRRFVEVTDPIEIAALEEALQQDQFSPVKKHLSQALALFADRKNPDYRNSIKESISAVEALAQILTKNDKASFRDALCVLEKSKGLHPALREGFTKLYGYTSDADGIRHAILDEPNLTPADAKFFLLSCTSFINYLKAVVPESV